MSIKLNQSSTSKPAVSNTSMTEPRPTSLNVYPSTHCSSMISMDADLKLLVDEMNDIFIDDLMDGTNEDIFRTSHQNNHNKSVSLQYANSHSPKLLESMLNKLNGLPSPNVLFNDINSFIDDIQQLSKYVANNQNNSCCYRLRIVS